MPRQGLVKNLGQHQPIKKRNVVEYSPKRSDQRSRQVAENKSFKKETASNAKHHREVKCKENREKALDLANKITS